MPVYQCTKPFVTHIAADLSTVGSNNVPITQHKPSSEPFLIVYEMLTFPIVRSCCARYGAGEMLEKRTPYYPWKAIFEQLIGVCVCVCVCERERERVCVCVCALGSL
jgi:hypothetical protein